MCLPFGESLEPNARRSSDSDSDVSCGSSSGLRCCRCWVAVAVAAAVAGRRWLLYLQQIILRQLVRAENIIWGLVSVSHWAVIIHRSTESTDIAGVRRRRRRIVPVDIARTNKNKHNQFEFRQKIQNIPKKKKQKDCDKRNSWTTTKRKYLIN